MDLLGGITSILGGGITGVVGSVVQRVFEFKTKKLDIELQKEKFANDIALRKVDAEIMAQEWASRTRVAEVEGAAKVETEDAKAFAAALTSEPKQFHESGLSPAQNWLMVVLDFVRGSVRPALTFYLCGLTTIIYFKCAKLLHNDIILPGMAYDIVTQVINTVLYLCSTCCLFWFGTRNPQKGKK
jgi:hypothetical protein